VYTATAPRESYKLQTILKEFSHPKRKNDENVFLAAQRRRKEKKARESSKKNTSVAPLINRKIHP
jgi:hypothetical protein